MGEKWSSSFHCMVSVRHQSFPVCFISESSNCSFELVIKDEETLIRKFIFAQEGVVVINFIYMDTMGHLNMLIDGVVGAINQFLNT